MVMVSKQDLENLEKASLTADLLIQDIQELVGSECALLSHIALDILDKARGVTHSLCRLHLDAKLDANPDIAGQCEQLSKASSISYMYEAMTMDIKADTTDEDIDELLDVYIEDAKIGGYSLDRDAVERAMIEMRDEKIAKESDN